MTEQKLNQAKKIMAEREEVWRALRMLNGEGPLCLEDGRTSVKLPESARMALKEEFGQRSVELLAEFEKH